MNKPEYISFKDWEILNNKYSSKDLEEYFKKDYPYQYLIGDVDFCDNKILVDERVLIPRFETEFLVKEVVNLIKKTNCTQPNIIDLCTGSGCIAISLKKEIDCKMTAVDISEPALELAKKNAKLNEVDIEFINKDILNDSSKYSYDIVTCNPPYIAKDELVGSSTKYEPQIALFAENNGLIFYEHILKHYKAKLYAFEIGYQQSEQIKDMIKKNYPNANILLKRDYAGLNRYIFIIN